MDRRELHTLGMYVSSLTKIYVSKQIVPCDWFNEMKYIYGSNQPIGSVVNIFVVPCIDHMLCKAIMGTNGVGRALNPQPLIPHYHVLIVSSSHELVAQ